MPREYSDIDTYFLSISDEIESAPNQRLLEIAQELKEVYDYSLDYYPTPNDQEAIENFRDYITFTIEAIVEEGDDTDNDDDDYDEDNDELVDEIDVEGTEGTEGTSILEENVENVSADEILGSTPNKLLTMYNMWVKQGVKPVVKPGSVKDNERFMEWMIARNTQKSSGEVCSLRDFANPKGCKDGYVCDIGSNKCIKKVSGQLVEVYEDIELTGTQAELQAWKKELAKYKQSLIIRKDGNNDIIIPPCNVLVDGKEYKGCDNDEYCNLGTAKCVKVKDSSSAEATINGHKIFGTAEAVRNFVKKVQERTKSNGIIENIIYNEKVMYSREELESKTKPELKNIAVAEGIYIKSTALKQQMIEALLASSARTSSPKRGSSPARVSSPARSSSPTPKRVSPKISNFNQGLPYTQAELENMTVKVMKELASKAKITISSKITKKADIIAHLLSEGIRKEGEVDSPIQNSPKRVSPARAPSPIRVSSPKRVPSPVRVSSNVVPYTEKELSSMTIPQIKKLASDAGTSIPSTYKLKAAIIAYLLSVGISKTVSSPQAPSPVRVSSPKRVSPQRVSPQRVSPQRVSPIRVSPQRVSSNVVPYTEKELSSMTVKNLKELASTANISVPSKLLKAGVVALLLEKGISKTGSSPKRVSPQRVSPQRVSPVRVSSPKRVSPKRVSPKRVSPARVSSQRVSSDLVPYTEQELSGMTVKNLKELASTANISVPSKLLKAGVVALLLEKGLSKAGTVSPLVRVSSPKRVSPQRAPSPKRVSPARAPSPVRVSSPKRVSPKPTRVTDEEEKDSKPEKPTIASVNKLSRGTDDNQIASLRIRLERCATLLV